MNNQLWRSIEGAIGVVRCTKMSCLCVVAGGFLFAACVTLEVCTLFSLFVHSDFSHPKDTNIRRRNNHSCLSIFHKAKTFRYITHPSVPKLKIIRNLTLQFIGGALGCSPPRVGGLVQRVELPEKKCCYVYHVLFIFYCSKRKVI